MTQFVFSKSEAGKAWSPPAPVMYGDSAPSTDIEDRNDKARLISFLEDAVPGLVQYKSIDDRTITPESQAKIDKYLTAKFGTTDIKTSYDESGKYGKGTVATRFYKGDGKGGYTDTGVARVTSDPGRGDLAAILGTIAPFATAGLSPALSQAMGGGTIGKFGSQALIKGTISAASGGNFFTGAAAGALGAATPDVAKLFSSAGVSDSLSKLLSQAVIGAGKSTISGGNPITGAVMSSIPGVNTGNSIVNTLLNNIIRTGIAKQLPTRKGF